MVHPQGSVARLGDQGRAISGWAVVFALIAIGINVLIHLEHENAPDEHRNITHAWQKLHIATDIGASIAALLGTALAVSGVPLADTIISIGIVVVIWIRIMKYLLDLIFDEHGSYGHHH